MTKWCVVPNCKTGSRGAIKRSVFRVPKDVAMWKKWEEAIPGIKKLNQTDVVCERHFTEADISREWIKIDANGKLIARSAYKHPQLKKNVVPSKFHNDQIGYRNCVPMHEYAKPFTDSHQKDPPIIANQCNVSFQSSDLKTPEIQGISTFSGITDVSHSTTGVATNICKREPSPFEESGEFGSQIATKMPLIKISKHITDVHHSTTTAVGADICKRELSPFEVSGELPVAKAFVPKMPSMEISEHITDVPHSTTAVITDICKKEPSPFEESSELPVAKTIVSHIPAKMSSMEIEKHDTDVHHSTTIIGADICKKEPLEESGELPVAKTFVSQIPAKMPSIKISKRLLKENAAVDRDFSAHVPKGWAWVNMRTQIVQQTLFTYAVTKLENDVHCPVIQKAVALDADGKFQYFVYGRHVDPQGSTIKNLEKTLRSEEALKDVLVKFKGMNICSGLGDVSIHLVEPGTAYQDYVNTWRTKTCSLISQKKRCESCTKTRKCIQQRTKRLKNPLTPKRIHNISNPLDQRKLIAMRMRLRCERRQRIRAQDRVKHLTACVKAFMGNHG